MKLLPLLFATLTLTVAGPTLAGSAAESEPQFAADEISRFAKSVEKFAAAKGARAFIIGRMGRPAEELPRGVEFTHTAVAIYSAISLPDGSVAKGYAIHNLYQTAEDISRSELVVDYPVDFFWGAHAMRAGIIIPTPALQQRLVAAYSDGTAEQVHRPGYSVVASPYNDQFQNCTEHTLDVINAAIYQTTDYARLKANTQAHFQAQVLDFPALKLVMANLMMKDLSTRDHSGPVATATFATIADYLQHNQLMGEALVLEADGTTSPILPPATI